MLNICLHVPVDGPNAAVALKWPDGRSCSLCGIQTELRLLWLHREANVYDSLHPFVTPDLLSYGTDAEPFFRQVMRNDWKLKREGYTVYAHISPSDTVSDILPVKTLVWHSGEFAG